MIKRKLKTCKKCGQYTYLWSHGCCQKCWFKLNPLKKKPLSAKKKDRFKAVSERGKARNLEYKKARAEFLETHDVCQVNLPDCLVPYPVEDKSMLQVHHKKGRTGDLLTDQRYFLCVCHNCHRWIEDHPTIARENGWSLPRID